MHVMKSNYEIVWFRLFGLLAHGEGWHNNHHAFEYSARQGFEWWQIDITWYLIRFLEMVGLAIVSIQWLLLCCYMICLSFVLGIGLGVCCFWFTT